MIHGKSFSMVLVVSLFLVVSCTQAVKGMDYDQIYYVTTLQGVSCTVESCLTLSEFASNVSHYLWENTTLVFQQGNHTLNSRFQI